MIDAFLSQSQLFENIDHADIAGLLNCLRSHINFVAKDHFIIEEGASITNFCLLLEGQMHAIKSDVHGRLTIITLIEPGDVLGVMLAANPERTSPVAVQAVVDSAVLSIPFASIIGRCKKNCPKHEQLLTNYIRVVAEKGLELHERTNCLLESSVRQKIMAYLRRLVREQGKNTVQLPLDRSAMAAYLHIERSALSRELSRMKSEGIIDYKTNIFKVIK